MKWCCAIFEGEYKSAGERGSSILIGLDYFGNPEFTLQHRAADNSIEQIPNTNFPIAWVSEARIFFCPWCGRELKNWYRKDLDNLYRPDLKIPDMKVTDN